MLVLVLVLNVEHQVKAKLHYHVACGAGKSTVELGLQETRKNTCLTHTRFLMQKVCSYVGVRFEI